MTGNRAISSRKQLLVKLIAASSGNYGGSTHSNLPYGSQLDTVMLRIKVHLGNVGLDAEPERTRM